MPNMWNLNTFLNLLDFFFAHCHNIVMEILKVTIEYDTSTYVAEGEDAKSWRQWMLQVEEQARSRNQWVWNNWTQVLEHPKEKGVPTGPEEPEVVTS